MPDIGKLWTGAHDGVFTIRHVGFDSGAVRFLPELRAAVWGQIVTGRDSATKSNPDGSELWIAPDLYDQVSPIAWPPADQGAAVLPGGEPWEQQLVQQVEPRWSGSFSPIYPAARQPIPAADNVDESWPLLPQLAFDVLDYRHSAIPIPRPGRDPETLLLRPEPPPGTRMALVAGTTEAQQENVLLHCDDRLRVPRRSLPDWGSPNRWGTPVVDVVVDGATGEVSQAPQSFLQDALTVAIAAGDVPATALALTSHEGSHSLRGLQVWGLGDTRLADGVPVPADQTGAVTASAWAEYGGPFHMGHGFTDRHREFRNRENEPIQPLHLNAWALFYADERRDGPLRITQWEPGEVGDSPRRVFMGFNDIVKAWDWVTFADITPPDNPYGGNPNRPPGGGGGNNNNFNWWWWWWWFGPGGGNPPGPGGGEDEGGGDGIDLIDLLRRVRKLEDDAENGAPGAGDPTNPDDDNGHMAPGDYPSELFVQSLQIGGARDRGTQPYDWRYGMPWWWQFGLPWWYGDTGQPGPAYPDGSNAPAPGPGQPGSPFAGPPIPPGFTPGGQPDPSSAPNGPTGVPGLPGTDGGGIVSPGPYLPPDPEQSPPNSDPGTLYSPWVSRQQAWQRLHDRLGGPTPMVGHFVGLPAVDSTGHWIYHSQPKKHWRRGTSTVAPVVFAPGGWIPDGPDDQSDWVGEAPLILYPGTQGGTATSFGWADWSQTDQDWFDGAMTSLVGSSGSRNLQTDFRDSAGSTRTNAVWSIGADVNPVADSQNYLGSSSKRWAVGYFDSVGTITSPIDDLYGTDADFAGDVTIDGKLTVGGLIDPTGMVLTEQGSAPDTLSAGEGMLWVDDSTLQRLLFTDDNNNSYILNGELVKTYPFSSPGGGSGTYYVGGYYKAPIADANLTQASTTRTYGTANIAYGAHAFIVCGAAGSVDAGVVGIRVTGTSITDAGVRTTSDSETLSADITGVSTDQYLETAKKWIGQVTFELYTVSGSPTAYSLDFNYGLAKYEDFANNNFDVHKIEMVGRAGANDSAFNVELLHHKATGWTYSAAAFTPGSTAITSLQSVYNTEYQLANGEDFAFKVTGIDQEVAGAGSEGTMFRITTGANNSVETSSIHIGVRTKL